MTARLMIFKKRISLGPIPLVTMCLLLIQGVTVARAATPEILVAASVEEVFIGDSLDYQVEVRNLSNPVTPDLSALKELFEVVATGDQSRDQSSVTIINGRVNKQSVLSHIYQFRITPKVAGELTIPAAKMVVDGKTISSGELPLKVIEAEEQDLVIAEILTSRTKVYPTQPFRVTLRVFVKPLPNNPKLDPLTPLKRKPPHIQANWVTPPSGLAADDKSAWLQPLLADDGVGFTLNDVNTSSGSFFDGPRSAVFNLSQGRESRNGLDGEPINYFVYELSRTLTPEKTGIYSLGPALIKGTFVMGVERKEYLARRLVTNAPAVAVEVREVPSPRPATYCGGIGEYAVSASASPAKLRVGDPLTLTVEVKRGSQSGSLEMVSAPDLLANEQLAADFDVIDRSPTGRVEGSTKKFAYALRPKRPGVTLPAFVVSVFNPESEEFQNLETISIPLEVTETERLASGELIGTRASTGLNSMKSRAEGIFQNITDPAAVHDQRIGLIPWGLAAIVTWFSAVVVIGLLALSRRKSSDAGWIRRQQARGTANRRLVEARTLVAKGESSEGLRRVRLAIIGLVADFQNRVADGMTTAEVEQSLQSAPIHDADRTEIFKLLELIESADYGAGQSVDPSLTLAAATTWIAKVAPRLERGA